MYALKMRTNLAIVLIITTAISINCDSDNKNNVSTNDSYELKSVEDSDIDFESVENATKSTDAKVRQTTEATTDAEVTRVISEEVSDVTEYVTEASTDDATMLIDNNVYRSKETTEDEDYSIANNIDGVKLETSTTQATTKSIEDLEPPSSNLAELEEDMDISGQRSPKTENTDQNQADGRNFDAIPRPPPAASKSSTLKGWLEDTWLRPPAGILVPLRPMALNRALAVWNDLTAGGLNVSDIVIVGYDSNGVNWRSRHSLQPTNVGSGDRAVAEALSKLLMKYQGVNTDSSSDGTMRALASAAKLVPYDSALFVVTDKGAGDPQRLPLALRALVEKRLKVYTIWTDPTHPSSESEEALQELRNVSRHTEGEVLPYNMQVLDLDNSLAQSDLDPWDSFSNRRGRLNSQVEANQYDMLFVKRGGGEAISLGFPVENGVTALRIFIEGAVEHAVLYPPNEAPQIDLYNESSVSAFSPSSRTDSLSPRDVHLVFPGEPTVMDTLSVLPVIMPSDAPAPMVGTWHLSVRCDTCDYRLCVSARTHIHFDTEIETDNLKMRVTGPVASVRESSLVDEYGTELAKLPFSYQPITGEGQQSLDPIAEVVSEVTLPSVKGSRIYVKILGRDVKGEPFTRFSNLNSSEARLERSAAIVFPDAPNDLERAEEYNSKIYSRQMTYNDSNSVSSSRAVSQVMNQRGIILTTVQVGLSTRLYGAPGDSLQLHFEVTNYREQSVSFRFGAVGELRFLRSITPAQQTVASGQTVNVIVNLIVPTTSQPGARDLITFTAYGLEQVSISAYVYVVNVADSTDIWAPELRHNFQGSCIGRMGTDCSQHIWSATIIGRDSLGGLLRISSSPIGIMYESNFISGTRDEVIATYRATCCAPRVLINAVDAYGNANSYIIDISSYLTPTAIAAIVLGVFLFLALLALIIYLIYLCVKRRKESRELPSYSTSRNIS